MPQDFQAQLQNAIGLFQVARSHHEQLTTFATIIAFGVLGFTMTDSYSKVQGWWRFLLLAAYVAVSGAIILSLYDNAVFHNQLLASIKKAVKAGEPGIDFNDIFSTITPVSYPLLFGLHVGVAVVVSLFCLLFSRKTVK